MKKKNKKTKKIVIFSIVAILVIGVVSFLIFNGSAECSPGEDKCDGSIYFICQDENFVSQGEIPGKCGVAEEQWKETFYRFSENVCSAVSIYPDDKTVNDYLTLEECQENVEIVTEEVYQEDANETLCGSGWVTGNCPGDINDGYWNTFGSTGGPSQTAYYYATYIKPAGAESSSYWKVKDMAGTTNVNIIPECFIGTKIEFRLRVNAGPSQFYVRWDCKDINSGNWYQLRSENEGSNYRAYEEAMVWIIVK